MSYQSTVIADGANYYWRLNETSGTKATDSIGGNHGTYTGTPNSAYTLNSTPAPAGIGDNSVFLNGSTGFISTTKPLTLPGGAFSVEIWFKTTFGGGGELIQFNTASDATGGGYNFAAYIGTDGRAYLFKFAGGTVILNTTDTYNDGNWHHFVGVVGANNAMTIYIDSVATTSANLTGLGSQTSSFWVVGRGNPSNLTNATGFFSGNISQAAIYSSTALTAVQVTNHYNLGILGNPIVRRPYTNIALSAGSKALGALNSSQSSSQLVRTSTGYLYAILAKAPGTLYIYKSTNNGASWSLQDYHNAPPYGQSSGPFIAAAIDASDVIHIAYLSINGAQTSYVQYNTTTNTYGSVELVTATPANPISIAVDSSNVPHIAGINGSTSTWYTNRTAANVWKPIVTIGTPTLPTNIDIQIDNNNVPQVSWIDSTPAATVAIGNKNNATSFTTQIVDSNATTAGGSSIIIDTKGNTWLGYQGPKDSLVKIVKHISTDPWSTWQAPITNGFNGRNISLAADQNDIYVFYERNLGGIAYDHYDIVNGKWLGETILQAATNNFRPHNPFVKWSQYFNNGDTGANNANGGAIEYLFDDGSTIYYDKLQTAQTSTGLAQISFTPVVGAFTTSTSSTSTSSTSTSTSSTSSTSSSTSSTSTSSTSTSSTSTSTSSTSSTSSSTSSTSTSSTSTSSTSTSTSSTSSTSSSTSSTSTSSTSTSSTSTSSTSSSTSSTSTSSTSTSSTSTSTSSTSSTSSSTSSTSTSSTSTSSTSTSTSSTSSTSSSTSSTSTSSTSTSTSSTSSTSSSTSSTSTSSTSTSSTSTSTSSTSSTSSSTSSTSTSSTSTSSTSTSTSSTSSTSSSTSSTSSTSSSTSSTSTSSTSTSSTSTSTSSTSSTSSSTSSTSTSSTSTSSTSTSTSSTSSTSSSTSSTSTSSTSTSSTSTSTSSTSTSSTSSTSSSTSSTSTSSTSTSSTSTSTSSTSTSSTSSSSTSSTSSSTSSTSTSSTSTSSTSTSSTSSSTSSTSTSSTSSTSNSTSSTSTSTTITTTTSTSSTSISSTSISTSSTSLSTSTSTTVIDINHHPRSSIAVDNWWHRWFRDAPKTKIRTNTR